PFLRVLPAFTAAEVSIQIIQMCKNAYPVTVTRTKLGLDVRQVHASLAAACAAGDPHGAGGYSHRFGEHHWKEAERPSLPTPPGKLVGLDLRFVHEALAGGCEKCWPTRNDAREYSLMFLPKHLSQLERWTNLTGVMTNLSFLDARIASTGVHDLI